MRLIHREVGFVLTWKQNCVKCGGKEETTQEEEEEEKKRDTRRDGGGPPAIIEFRISKFVCWWRTFGFKVRRRKWPCCLLSLSSSPMCNTSEEYLRTKSKELTTSMRNHQNAK